MNPNQDFDPAANRNGTPEVPPLVPQQPVAPQQFAPTPEPIVIQPTVIQPTGAPAQPTVTPSQPVQTAVPQPQMPDTAAPAVAQTPTPPPAAPVPTQSVYGGPVYGAPVNPEPLPDDTNKAQKRKRLIFGGAAAAVAVVLLGLGGVFGLYLPNTPDNVYKTGLNRTGKVVDELVTEGFEPAKLEALKNSQLSGTIEVDAGGTQISGSFNSKYDINTSDSSLTYKGADGNDLTMQILSDAAEGALYPDIYFKVSGLSALGLDEYVPQAKDYEGKWVGASAEYLKSLIPADSTELDAKNEFTEKDAAELTKITTKVTREYVFNADPQKSVLVKKGFIGTEKLDGDITANRYEVTISEDNAKKYCRALTEAFMSAEAYKHIPGVKADKIEEDKNKAVKECDDIDTKSVEEDSTVEMWVDKKLKLIHKVRVSDKDDKGTFAEFGQTYKKGDTVPMFALYHSDRDKYEGKLTLDVDTKKSVTKGALTFETSGDEKYGAKATFEFKPHEGEVNIEKPKDFIPLSEVLKAFNVDPAALTSGSIESDLQPIEAETTSL